MIFLSSGSRLQSFLFSVVRLVSALVTFCTLGFVYTGLEMLFADKDMSFGSTVGRILELGYLSKKRMTKFWWWYWWETSEFIGVFTLLALIAGCVIMLGVVKENLYSRLVPTTTGTVWATDYQLPGVIGPQLPEGFDYGDD